MMHPSFLTLTYDDEHLPFDLGLDVEDWQKFIRALRKRVGRLRYYHCGEYGSETDRPHYHAVIWGCDFSFDRKLYRTTPYGNLYTSPTIDRIWGKGYAPFGDVTPQSCAYVAGYVTKKLWGDRARDEYATAWGADLETGEIVPQMWKKPPYSTMSLKPGIGRSYVEKYGEELYRRDEFLELGKKVLRPPKYFDKWLEETDPERLEAVQYERKQKADRYWRDRHSDRLRVKDRINEHREKRKGRDPHGK